MAAQGSPSPFHAGEHAVQTRLGVRDKIEAQGHAHINESMTASVARFLADASFILVGSLEGEQPWASLLVGAADSSSFVTTPDRCTVQVRARPLLANDPLHRTLLQGAKISLLGIDFETRYRFRVNGTVSAIILEGFVLHVDQSYSQCPQYIASRRLGPMKEASSENKGGDSHRTVPSRRSISPAPIVEGPDNVLSDADVAFISRADTFFIASASSKNMTGSAQGTDISHRGGRPGFVKVVCEEEEGGEGKQEAKDAFPANTHAADRTRRQRLVFPDYVGNFFFNTIGNLMVFPRAGLLFWDFERQGLLMLTGETRIIWSGSEVSAFTGAQRLVEVTVTKVVRFPAKSVPLKCQFVQPSSLLSGTGTWTEAGQSLRSRGEKFLKLEVAAVTEECDGVKSFVLTPAAGPDAPVGLPPYEPGQYLPVRLRPRKGEAPVVRFYSLSDAPDGKHFRLTVKRLPGGLISPYMHEHVKVGSVIETMGPRGGFIFNKIRPGAPAVFISAGVGVTPFVAMLNQQLGATDRTRDHRPMFFIHGARNKSQHVFGSPFGGHIRELAVLHNNLKVHVRYSQPAPSDRQGFDYDSQGHIDMALIQAVVPSTEMLQKSDVYLCGPSSFMKKLYVSLRDAGVARQQLHYEYFDTGAASDLESFYRKSPAYEVPTGEDGSPHHSSSESQLSEPKTDAHLTYWAGLPDEVPAPRMDNIKVREGEDSLLSPGSLPMTTASVPEPSSPRPDAGGQGPAPQGAPTTAEVLPKRRSLTSTLGLDALKKSFRKAETVSPVQPGRNQGEEARGGGSNTPTAPSDVIKTAKPWTIKNFFKSSSADQLTQSEAAASSPSQQAPPPPMVAGVTITFARKNRKAVWTGPADGSLLEFGEAQGLRLPYGCRGGVCGRCSVKLLKGEVDYVDEVLTDVAEGHILTCVTVPMKQPCNMQGGKRGSMNGTKCEGCRPGQSLGVCQYGGIVLDF